MDVLTRYSRNREAVGEAEQAILAESRVLVVGCGGLGGYLVEFLGRVGVGRITVVDGDVFEESNLNRQLFATADEIGRPKVDAAERRMRAVNPLVQLTPVCEMLTEENARGLLTGQQVAVDALDNIPARLLLGRTAAELGIPLVHGAIAGWRGHVCVVQPGDDTLHMLYDGAPDDGRGEEIYDGSLGFTAAAVASLQAAETVKLLLKRGMHRDRELLELDLLNGEWMVFPL